MSEFAQLQRQTDPVVQRGIDELMTFIRQLEARIDSLEERIEELESA